MKNLSGIRCAGTSIAMLMIAVFALVPVVSNVSADMRVKLKDGRILKLPVAPDQIDSVTFGPDSAAKGPLNQKQPVRRAADQARADERSIQTSRDAERRAVAAAKAAKAAANMAGDAAALAKREAAAATAARKSAEAAARSAPTANPAPGTVLKSAPPLRRYTGDAVKRAGRVLIVGPGKTSQRPSDAAKAAKDGDTIEITAGVYKGDVAKWVAHNLTIRGVGGRPHMDSGGASVGGKAIWVVSGNNTVIENIEFSHCRVPDQNGAGIRLEGRNLTVRDSYFHNNDMGIVTGNRQKGDVLIEGSEFARNAVTGKTGVGHNIYIGQERSFTLRNSYVHGAVRGHNVKSRARENRLLYNRIVDGQQGAASYLVDIAEGGRAWLVGNVFHKGGRAENRPAVSFAAERRGAKDRIALINNTLASELARAVFLQNRGGTAAVVLNNILAGPVAPAVGPAELRHNLIAPADPMESASASVKARPGKDALKGNFVAHRIGFTNASKMDFTLTRQSPARDIGVEPGLVNGWPARPSAQYRHPLRQQSRPNDGKIDIGAYEYAGG
jgi:hypothetical protein